MGEGLYHPRPSTPVWGSVRLGGGRVGGGGGGGGVGGIGVGGAVAVGGAAANGIAQLGRPGVPDYFHLPWPAIVASAGDVAIWLGLGITVASVCALALA